MASSSKQDDGNGNGNENEMMTMMTPEPEKKEDIKEESDDHCRCPICLEDLPKWATQFIRMTCCGNGIHRHCAKDLMSTKHDEYNDNCILCRAKIPSSDEESINQLRPWVKKKKAWSQLMMGQHYYHGHGVKQSYETARELYELAAQQEYVTALYDLGLLYKYGEGVEQSYERAFQYYEHAAHLGFAEAQYNLGCMYSNGKGVVKDTNKMKEWFQKAATQNHKIAIKRLKRFEENVK